MNVAITNVEQLRS